MSADDRTSFSGYVAASLAALVSSRTLNDVEEASPEASDLRRPPERCACED